MEYWTIYISKVTMEIPMKMVAERPKVSLAFGTLVIMLTFILKVLPAC